MILSRIFLMGLALPVLSQTSLNLIKGKVLDEFGTPVGACIVGYQGNSLLKDTTDALGNFEVSRPTTGIIIKANTKHVTLNPQETDQTFFAFTGQRWPAKKNWGHQPLIGRIPEGRNHEFAGMDSHREFLELVKLAVNMGAPDSLSISCPDYLLRTISIPSTGTAVEVKVNRNWDIVVYGGTSGGIIAAVQAAKMGKHVLLVSPDKRIGGLTSGGLGETDIGNKAAIGGLSREFYRSIAKKYSADSLWTRELKTSYPRYSPDEMWTFEPKVALSVFQDLISQNQIPIFYSERLDLAKSVVKNGKRIISMVMESGKTFTGKMFIDATYEGDLMAKAGVSYAIGREPNTQYGETFNGIETIHAVSHQLHTGISPYIKAGVPTSGLLPGVFANVGGVDGAGDKKVQAYNYRMTLTMDAVNRIPFSKPAGYDEGLYELLFRHIEAGYTGTDFFNFNSMPNHKTDSNNSGGFSTDFIGMNYAYPDGSYAVRSQIIMAHEVYQRGLLWTLANHPRIPQAIRDKYSLWGLAKDEYTENNNWSPQLYIREARRMVGAMVMTQKEVTQAVKITKSIGMAAYTMDSHNTQRYVDTAGQVRNEGDVQQKGFGPYPVDYGALVPKLSECTNLLVPFCLSASHIAFGSIRMEPVFMLLSQTAATAAANAIDEGVDIQAVDYAKLRARLLADKQILDLP